MSVIFRIVMAFAGVITSWFVAKDADNFTVIQTIVSIVLIVVCFTIAAFWPSLAAWFRRTREPKA